jgi:polysaccharide export outer membrane protein
MRKLLIRGVCIAVLSAGTVAPLAAQLRQAAPANAAANTAVADVAPPRFVIGIGDVLSISFWRDEKLSRDVLVRPDGHISLPLLNDIPAAGRTPEQLAGALSALAVKFVTDPNVTVIVKEIHSRRVFVVGEVTTPGALQLIDDTTVLQALGMAGGLREYADKKHIVIIRSERGQQQRLKFNYENVLKGKDMKQNILPQPGDTIVVR